MSRFTLSHEGEFNKLQALLPPPKVTCMNDLIADYIRATNRGRAEAFYRRLFARAALMAGPSFTFFNVNGQVFGLLETDDESKCERWCKPFAPHLKVEVADVKAEAARLAALSVPIVRPLSDVGHRRFVQFMDTEGNTIELYQTMFVLDRSHEPRPLAV